MVKFIDEKIQVPEILLEFYDLTNLLILHSEGIFLKDSTLKNRSCNSASIEGSLFGKQSSACCPSHRSVLILASLADIAFIDHLKIANVEKIIIFDAWSPLHILKRIFFSIQKRSGYRVEEYFVFKNFDHITSIMPTISIVPPRRTWSVRGRGLLLSFAKLLHWSLYRVKLSRELLFDRIVVYDCETTLKF